MLGRLYRKLRSTGLALGAGLIILGCLATEAPERPAEVLGGVEIPGHVLAQGERTYRAVCASCHGPAGDGMGRLGVRQNPKPRSFAQGVIKFASVPAGELWVDEDVLRTLRRGLRGTQMIAVRVPDEDLRAVVHYIKRFSSRWRTETPGTPVKIPSDPWANPREATGAGRELYARECASCHEEGKSVPSIWADPVRAPMLAEYRPKAGAEPETLYRTVAAGIGGIEGKQGLATSHTPREIWSLVHLLRTRLRLD
ncbi:MAG: cytochrome c [Myxococcota bacterium]